MTKELKAVIDAEMESALDSQDTDRIRDAVAHATKALCDCQMKTADRVKTIAADHPVLVQDVKEIKAIVARGKRAFAEAALAAFKWIVIGGGGVEFARWMLTRGGAGAFAVAFALAALCGCASGDRFGDRLGNCERIQTLTVNAVNDHAARIKRLEAEVDTLRRAMKWGAKEECTSAGK